MTRAIKSFLAVIALSGSLFAQTATYRHHGAALLPDPHATPGVVAISDAKKVCSTAWGKDERHVTASMKKEVCQRYGVKNCPGHGLEIDHLISRELGGADDVDNLWPQPYLPNPGAHTKDQVENWLHKQVCAGNMTLQEAQQKIKTDWYAVSESEK